MAGHTGDGSHGVLDLLLAHGYWIVDGWQSCAIVDTLASRLDWWVVGGGGRLVSDLADAGVSPTDKGKDREVRFGYEPFHDSGLRGTPH